MYLHCYKIDLNKIDLCLSFASSSTSLAPSSSPSHESPTTLVAQEKTSLKSRENWAKKNQLGKEKTHHAGGARCLPSWLLHEDSLGAAAAPPVRHIVPLDAGC
jgi:hypothetical protein